MKKIRKTFQRSKKVSHPSEKDLATANRGLDILATLKSGKNAGKDFTIVTSFTQETSKSKMPNGWRDHSNIAVGVVTKDNEKPIIPDYTLCFGCMDFNYKATKNATLLFAAIPHKWEKNVKERNGGAREMIDWLINYSPWSPAILTKDAEEVLKRGMILDANTPVNISFGALLFFKNIYACNRLRTKAFKDLVAEGCHPHIAILQLFIWGIYPGTIGGNSSSNSFVTPLFKKTAAKRFITNRPVYLCEPYSKCNSYRGFGYGSRLSRGDRNDSTVSHTFLTKKEWHDYLADYSDSNEPLGYRYTNTLIKSLDAIFKKTFNFKVSRYENTSLERKSPRKVFIEWSRKEFPSAYS